MTVESRPRGVQVRVGGRVIDHRDALDRGRQPHADGVEDLVVGEIASLQMATKMGQVFPRRNHMIEIRSGHSGTSSTVAVLRTLGFIRPEGNLADHFPVGSEKEAELTAREEPLLAFRQHPVDIGLDDVVATDLAPRRTLKEH